ncbi:nitrite reductase small subunit NirD [Indioceanicola profundi]|uniref:nitrite reductase small subunit NirD n=1 Tax=Indioceanicola profundi TaxID=2220096 RepID=UPI000E6AC273|nr:nitrite reductase small subunit NirD [Indioceanicola profundi]
MTTPVTWIAIGALADIPPRGARTVTTRDGEIAVFRTAADEVYALYNACPHKGGPLAQGIVHGRAVTCPLHNMVFDLATGEAGGEEKACARTAPVRLEGDRILLGLSAEALGVRAA